MEKPKIKAIVFDIGGVMASEKNLVDHYVPLCKSLNIDKKKFFNLRERYIGKASSGEISAEKMIHLISEDLRLDYKKLLKNWIKYKRRSIVKNHELEKIIRRLGKEGYRVASLSNVLDLHYRLCNEKKLYDSFEFNILSFEAGFSKPDPRIYKLLLKKLGLPAKQVVFIDDYQSCLDGAEKLGIKTILFKNNRQLVRDLKKFRVKI